MRDKRKLVAVAIRNLKQIAKDIDPIPNKSSLVKNAKESLDSTIADLTKVYKAVDKRIKTDKNKVGKKSEADRKALQEAQSERLAAKIELSNEEEE